MGYNINDIINETAFVDRVKILSEESIKSFFFSPFHLLLFTCLFSVCSYIVHSSLQNLDKLGDNIATLEKSIALLNTSLSVIDERTKGNEEDLIEIRKHYEKNIK